MTALLEVEELSKTFKQNTGLFGSTELKAVEQIYFRLERKQTLAIIGNNGSGKSILARMLVGIIEPTSGRILFNGTPLKYGDHQYRAKHIRMMFQDHSASLNPRLNAGQILDAPLRLLTNLNEAQRNEKIFHTLRLVGLYPDHANVRINLMSISQKQRIAFARALILEPEIIICDDALKHISDQMLVIDQGHMIEYGATRKLLSQPKADITRRLVESYFGKILDSSAWDTPSQD